MDLETESTIRVDTAMSSDIAKSCNKLLDVQKQISATEEQLKKLQEAENLLSEQTIPNLMQQAGISLLKLADGSWFVSYLVDNDDVWARVKEGEFKGFCSDRLHAGEHIGCSDGCACCRKLCTERCSRETGQDIRQGHQP